ncbi:MAG TPA: TRAP transporter small permease subunit [Rhodospirillales bacterium]
MLRFINFIDNLSTYTGKAFGWLILVLTLATAYEVFVRYALKDPTAWAFDISYTMYGAMFMMAGAYTLSRDGHVRGDVIYRLWQPKTQARVELVLYFVFFFPGILALIYSGISYAAESWAYRPYGAAGVYGEIAINSPVGIPVSPLKSLLPLAAFMALLQGFAEVARCICCIKTGVWPERLKDVEELDVALAHKEELQAAAEAITRGYGGEKR